MRDASKGRGIRRKHKAGAASGKGVALFGGAFQACQACDPDARHANFGRVRGPHAVAVTVMTPACA
ncbi:hypothetical protein PSAB6_360031 [Paraburkholderia sabiae]|nr:hypothetical protein PSAB6_360031 [Paraburkholderia sabiae]